MFKIGDTVICVDNEDMEHRIYVGASYTVSGRSLVLGRSLRGGMISLEEIGDDDMFDPSRFVLDNKLISPFQQWEKEYA